MDLAVEKLLLYFHTHEYSEVIPQFFYLKKVKEDLNNQWRKALP